MSKFCRRSLSVVSTRPLQPFSHVQFDCEPLLTKVNLHRSYAQLHPNLPHHLAGGYETIAHSTRAASLLVLYELKHSKQFNLNWYIVRTYGTVASMVDSKQRFRYSAAMQLIITGISSITGIISAGSTPFFFIRLQRE